MRSAWTKLEYSGTFLMRKAQISRICQTFTRNKWLIFLLWSLWLTLEYYGLGPFSYVFRHDCGDSIFPNIIGITREFLQYGLSCWTNIAACGFDRLAATGPFFSINGLLFLAFPPWLAYGLVIYLQRFIAGYFTYRLCRDHLKFGELTSIAAGMAYAVSFFYFQSQFFYFQSQLTGEAGLPFILWALEGFTKVKLVRSYIFAFLLGAACLMQQLSIIMKNYNEKYCPKS